MNQRVVLLGASNLTLSFPLILKMLHSGFSDPVEIHAAHGHGRSYGKWSRVLHRELPGINDCDLWKNLEQQSEKSGSTVALITDVGNDLIYRAEVSQIVEWVEACLNRLTAQQSQIVLTLLPMSSIERLSAWRYQATRMMFFPKHSSPWSEMKKRVIELNERLSETGRRFHVHIVEPPGHWYGMDPIHIRASRRKEAWNRIFSTWEGFGSPKGSLAQSLPGRIRTWRFRPAQRRIRGRLQTTPQPVLQTERTVLHLY